MLVQASISEKLAEFVKSGAIKAPRCGPTPKYKDARGGHNRGEGQAIQWLSSHVTYPEDACLIWPFPKTGHAGFVGYAGKIFRAGRLMCLLAHGLPPTNDHVAAFSCGNGSKGCIGPKHMSWKTQSDSLRDQYMNGRQPCGRQGKNYLQRRPGSPSYWEVATARTTRRDIRPDNRAHSKNPARNRVCAPCRTLERREWSSPRELRLKVDAIR